MGDLPDMAALQARAERDRVEFLRVDLELCFTMAATADTELRFGHWDAAARAIANVQEGQATIDRFLPGVEDEEQRSALQQTLRELHTVLDGLRSRLLA